MDNRGGRKIDYIELIRAIAVHWKPVFQNKQFRRAMLKCIVGTITFTAFWLFLFSLNPTGKALGELMKEIEPPPGAVKMGGGRDEERCRLLIQISRNERRRSEIVL